MLIISSNKSLWKRNLLVTFLRFSSRLLKVPVAQKQGGGVIIKSSILKTLLLVQLLMLPLMMTSQESGKKPSPFSLGVIFSPEYSYRLLKVTADSNDWITALSDSLEVAKFGYTTGFTASYDVLKRLTLETGMLFSDKGYKMTTSNFYAFDPIDPLLMKLESVTLIVSYYYLEIPIKVRYRIVAGKFSVGITTGISGNIFLDNKIKTIIRYNDGTPDEKDSSSGGKCNDVTGHIHNLGRGIRFAEN
jgi:hypothetical protein